MVDEFDVEDIDKHIDVICSGVKIIDVLGRTLLFKTPSSLIKTKSRYIYDKERNKAIVEDGLLTSDQMRELIQKRKLVTDEERSQVESLNNKIKAQEVLLAKTTQVRARQDKIKENITRLRNELDVIKANERSKYALTADTRAEESRILSLCWMCAYDYFSEQLYWSTQEKFNSETDLLFRQRVINEFIYFISGISSKIIRKIARSDLWRIRYITSLKTSETLFTIPICDYSNDMLNLVYWSHFYQSVYEMFPEDRPPDTIIDDDEALDAYLKSYYDEKKQEAAERKGRKNYAGSMSAFNKEEVIVTRSNELWDSVTFDEPKESKGIKDKVMVSKKSKRGYSSN